MKVRNSKSLWAGAALFALGCAAGALGLIVDFALLMLAGVAAIGLAFIETE